MQDLNQLLKPKKLTRVEICNELNRINTNDIKVLVSKLTQAKKYKYLKEAIIDTTSYLPDNCKFTERLYHLMYQLTSRPVCKTCGKNYTKFRHFNFGYFDHCSSKCAKGDSNKSSKQKVEKEKTNILKDNNNILLVNISKNGFLVELGKNPSGVILSGIVGNGGESTIEGIVEISEKQPQNGNSISKIQPTDVSFLQTGESKSTVNKQSNSISPSVSPTISAVKNPLNQNIFESEIKQFCEQHFNNIIYNQNDLNIFIPEINLAIECIGVYNYDIKYKNKNRMYHRNKFLECLKNNITLVQIFEDEWLQKQKIVKSMLLNRFKKSPKRIFARKCKITKIDNHYGRWWLDNNHLQGGISGKHYALTFKNQIVSLITIGKVRFRTHHDFEIYRFCNVLNTQVVGGLSRLLKHVERKYNNPSIITYADLRYGVGDGYRVVGFKYLSMSNPGYFYIHRETHNRYSRQKFQKHKLKKILKIFNPEWTEEQNMTANGYFRVYDCGNAVYEKV